MGTELFTPITSFANSSAWCSESLAMTAMVVLPLDRKPCGEVTLAAVKVRLPKNVRIRVMLERASEATLVELRQMIAASPGPGQLMLNLEQSGEFCVMLEPMGVTVGADRAFMDQAELLLGRGMVQALD